MEVVNKFATRTILMRYTRNQPIKKLDRYHGR